MKNNLKNHLLFSTNFHPNLKKKACAWVIRDLYSVENNKMQGDYDIIIKLFI